MTYMKRSSIGLTCFLIALAVLLGRGLYAQQTNVGSITGTVRDASGAIIPGVKVEVVNQGTSLKQTAVTNASGTYTITLLPIGSYTVTATQPGFQKSVKTDIPVLSGVTFTVDLEMRVGQVTQSVTVTGAAPVLDTTTANQGTTRTGQEIKELPIVMQGVENRGAISVVQSLAGVNADTGGQNQVWMVISRAQINGVLPGVVGYQIDGIHAGMGEPESAEDFGHPTPELVQEVRLTTNADASMGFDAGVTIAMTTRSGTNNLHGNVYYYSRNAAFNARQFFLKSVGKDVQNEGGFSLGGPVYIPKVYDGRNKTFFFGTLNIFTMANDGPFAFFSGITSQSVPTTLMRTGNFTELLGPQIGTDVLGRPIFQGEIYDPATTRPDGHGGFIRDPFTFNGQLNVIDPARISPISTFFQNGYKLPTTTGTQLNWTGTPYPSYLGNQEYVIKIDHAVNDRQRFSFTKEGTPPLGCTTCKGPAGLGRGHYRLLEGQGYLNPLMANGFFVNIPQDRYRFNYVWTMSPTVLFNFRAGLTRTKNRSIENYPAPESLVGAETAGLKGTLSPQSPSVNIQGLSPMGPTFAKAFWDPQKLPISVDLSVTKGNHNFKFGSDYVGVFDTFRIALNTHGSFSFADVGTGLPGQVNTGAGYASYLLGDVNSASIPAPFDGRSAVGAVGFYAQDSWRVTPKLTLNYGLRWDYFIPLHMGQDKMSSFDPNLANPGAGGRLGALAIFGKGAGRNGLTNSAEPYYKAFGPKFGLAYSINPKTVFRASYGISYFPYYQKYAGAAGVNVPLDGFTVTRTASSLDNGVTPAFNWNNGFPLTFPSFPILDPSLDNKNNIGYLDRKDNRPTQVQNIGAELSRELPGRISLRVGYVGTMIHRIFSSYDMNALPLSQLQLGSLLTQSITSPEAQAAGIPLPYPGFTGSVAQALRPYPQFLNVNALGAQIGNSTYHALQINVQRQFGDLTFLGNYTISKQLGNVFFGGAGGFGQNYIQHPDLRNSAKSICCGIPSENNAGDRPQALNLSWVWNLPFGSGKRYLGGAKGVLNQIVGGWRLSAIQQYQGSSSLRVTSRQTVPGLSPLWPVLVPGQPIELESCSNYDPGDPNSRRLNINAFAAPAPFTLGNVSVLSTVRRCRYLDEHLGLQKEFPVRENFRFSVGVLGQNIFNRHYWTGVNTDTGNPAAFGRFGGASYGRTMQLFARIDF